MNSKISCGVYTAMVGVLATQKSDYNKKVHGKCSCGSCSTSTKVKHCDDDELQKEMKQCCSGFCTSQPVCISPDPEACPKINNSGTNAGFQNDKYHSGNNSVMCIYGSRILTTEDYFNTWRSLYDEQNKHRDDYYLPQINYCLSDVEGSKCNTSTFDGGKPEKCPVILSNTPGGQVCRSMYLNEMPASSVSVMENAMASYCQEPDHMGLPACYCYSAEVANANKFSDTLQTIKAANVPQPGPYKCWFAPCMPSTTGTLNDVLLEKDTFTDTCDAPECANFANLYNDPNVDANITQTIVCSGAQPQAAPSTTSTDVSSSASANAQVTQSGQPSSGQSNLFTILNRVVFGLPLYVWILIVLALFVFAYIFMRKPSKSAYY